eukprot:g2188.t1
MALSGGGHLCVCVECGERTSDRLYEGYGVSRGQAMGHGGGRSGANIRLTRCRVCDSILDRYLEYDPVLVVIDLILHKSEVYRHLLFNSKSFSPWARKRSLRCNLLVFFLLMVLVDAHTKWRIDAELQQTTTATVQLHAEPDLMVEGHEHEILKSGVVTNSIAGDKGGVSASLLSRASVPVGLTSYSQFSSPQKVVVDLRQLPPALGGGCFNTSDEDAIIERWVEGIEDTESWVRALRLFSLSLAENIVYITSVVISIRLWQATCRRLSFAQWCNNKGSEEESGQGTGPSVSLDSDGAPLLSVTIIICAIILSSWGKVILIMLMIWDYANDMVHVVNLVVITSNVAAVQALLKRRNTPYMMESLILILIPFGILTLVRMALAHVMGLTVVYSTDWTPW